MFLIKKTTCNLIKFVIYENSNCNWLINNSLANTNNTRLSSLNLLLNIFTIYSIFYYKYTLIWFLEKKYKINFSPSSLYLIVILIYMTIIWKSKECKALCKQSIFHNNQNSTPNWFIKHIWFLIYATEECTIVNIS